MRTQWPLIRLQVRVRDILVQKGWRFRLVRFLPSGIMSVSSAPLPCKAPLGSEQNALRRTGEDDEGQGLKVDVGTLAPSSDSPTDFDGFGASFGLRPRRECPPPTPVILAFLGSGKESVVRGAPVELPRDAVKSSVAMDLLPAPLSDVPRTGREVTGQRGGPVSAMDGNLARVTWKDSVRPSLTTAPLSLIHRHDPTDKYSQVTLGLGHAYDGSMGSGQHHRSSLGPVRPWYRARYRTLTR